WFGSSGFTIGWVVTALVGLGALAGLIRWMFRPDFERRLAAFEAQGWFSTTSYKQQQGQKVRRGTILGILILGGAGVYTMISHEVLSRLPAEWALNIPFTGQVTVTDWGDVKKEVKDRYGDWEH